MDQVTVTIPASARALLDSPSIGFLATIRPDGSPQTNPMWFAYDEASGTIRFTHTTKRGKYRNLMANPAMSFCLTEPGNGYRYAEFRGRLAEVIADPEAGFYQDLMERYGQPRVKSEDAADRVILVMSVDAIDAARS
ncbi:pyridoxamine 5'-phosphate oxidase family protein [Pseudolysinimonas sp.]